MKIRFTDPSPVDVVTLSHRQTQILDFICDGLSSKQMADRLGLSIKTIEMHRTRLHGRLGTRNAQQVIRYAGSRHRPVCEGTRDSCARLQTCLPVENSPRFPDKCRESTF
jgi:DNA-binding CsgD family transcriptional regulator